MPIAIRSQRSTLLTVLRLSLPLHAEHSSVTWLVRYVISMAAQRCLVVCLRPEVAAQHDAPAPREAVDLLRHARCGPGMAGSTPLRLGCHWHTKRDQRPGTIAGSTATLAMHLLHGTDRCQHTDHRRTEALSRCGIAVRLGVRYNAYGNCVSLTTF
jgi:hypothetical protein